MSLNPKIFRKYDIRGTAQTDFPNEVVQQIGKAAGTYFQRRHGCQHLVVGRDNRLSGERLRTQFVAGVVSTGLDVLDIGICSTPTLYWYAATQETAGVMITGSHLDPIYNGFKMAIDRAALYGESIQALYQLIQTSDFLTGNGNYARIENSLLPYIDEVVSKVQPKPLKVVVDPGNGTAVLFVDALMSAWGQEAITINMTLDGSFPNHAPDPSKAKNLSQLIDRVRAEQADLGLAFDGDADRVVAIDDTGAIIAPDRLVALLARDVLTRYPGATIIGDVTSSQALFDTIEAAGGKPLMWMTGHSLIKEKMRETGAILAGEVSGHIFFAEDYYGFDDAYLAAGKLLHYLSHQTQRLSELNAALPHYYSTKVFRPHYNPDQLPQILAHLERDLRQYGDLLSIDGIRAQFDAGWAIIRPSNTEPVLSIRIEGKTRDDAIRYRDWVVASLSAFDDIDIHALNEV